MKLNHRRYFEPCIIIHYYKYNCRILSESYFTIKRIGGYIPSILFAFHPYHINMDIIGNIQRLGGRKNLWRKIF